MGRTEVECNLRSRKAERESCERPPFETWLEGASEPSLEAEELHKLNWA